MFYFIPYIYIYGGTRIQMADKVYIEVNLGKHRRIFLGKNALNSCLGFTTIVDEGVEDICLNSEGRRGTELEGAQGNPRGNKGNLVFNKEEKKKEGKSAYPLRIKCTATT